MRSAAPVAALWLFSVAEAGMAAAAGDEPFPASLSAQGQLQFDASAARLPFHTAYLESDLGGDPGFELRNFTQKVDHFNFAVEKQRTWNQRYMISTGTWDASKQAPIMFFTGAEGGDITRLYSYAYGYILEVAKELGALVVFMEHRFFGKSMPLGSDVWSRPGMKQNPERGLLSIEQGLADYADLITAVLNNYSAWDSPTVSFGGSLAGTLAALMRVRYPHLIDMAWASSTPLFGYPGLCSQFAWRKQVTDNFEAFSPGCSDLVRKGFRGISRADSAKLSKAIPVCEPPSQFQWDDIQQVAWGILESDGEFCYPPSRSGINAHCAAMGKGSNMSERSAIFTELVKSGGQIYFSTRTDGSSCLNLTAYKAEQHTANALGWQFLAATTIVHPIGANDITDMFPAFNWSLDSTKFFATRDFNVTPDATHIPTQFGLNHVKKFVRANSRIVFVYGLRDPWHTLGVGVTDLAADLPVVTIADGSHCADTYVPGPYDTPTMLAGRAKVVNHLKAWIAAVRLEKAL